MDTPEKKLPELVNILNSCIRRRNEPAIVSRDFWMPDQSCRVCYECESQFTTFNRRHHCRLCGRIFCARCSVNSIPIHSDDPKIIRDEGERIRVCNYCFKQWDQEVVAVDYRFHTSSQGLSPSPSTTNLGSPKSSGAPIYPLYTVEASNAEPADIQNNGLLGIPPELEDLEDEREAVLFDDDEDVDEETSGRWGSLRSLSSFGSGEYRGRNRSFKEHIKVMKNVVDEDFRALVTKLLQEEDLPVSEIDYPENWLDIITSLSWEAAPLLKPDSSKGEGMGFDGYVKVKCLACGRPSQSMVVKGVVCTKNVAHWRMRSKIEKPRILVLGGRLEYNQEMDHLERAAAHHPNVLLVEKSVSCFALDHLLEEDISCVLKIKRPLLERIARCTDAQIVSSTDHLPPQKLGYCDMFHVEKFLEEHGSAGQVGKKLVKTLMFFEGCLKPLGCTILLKGANGDELKKVKRVLQYGVFAAYNFALERYFLADQGASLPEIGLRSPITVALPDKLSNEVLTESVMEITSTVDGGQAITEDHIVADGFGCLEASYIVIRTDDVHSDYNVIVGNQPVTQESRFLKEDTINDHEEPGSKEGLRPSLFDPQSILVSLLTRSVWKGTVCKPFCLVHIKYYGSFDKPLGRYLRDDLFDQSYRCHSCEMPSEAHFHRYTYWQGSLTVTVEKLPEVLLPGEQQGKIWMWYRCLQCPRTDGFPPEIRRIVMSDATWSLSFGKFLELSFLNNEVASCGHSLHRDCLRFYGSGRMVACFKYASLDDIDSGLTLFDVYKRKNEANDLCRSTQICCTSLVDALYQLFEKICPL